MSTRTILWVPGLLLVVGGVGCFDPKLEAMETFTCTGPGDCPTGYACVEELPGQRRCHRSCKEENDCKDGYQCISSGIDGELVCMSMASPDGGPPVDGPWNPELGPPPPDGGPPPLGCQDHYEVGSTLSQPVGMLDIAATPDGVYLAWVDDNGALVLGRPISGIWKTRPLLPGKISQLAMAADVQNKKLHLVFVHESARQMLMHCSLNLPLASDPNTWACADKSIYDAGLGVIDAVDIDARDGVVALALKVVDGSQEQAVFGKLDVVGPPTFQKHCAESAILPLGFPRVAAGPNWSVGSVWQSAGNTWKLVRFKNPGGRAICPVTDTRIIDAGVAMAPGAITIDGDQAFFAGAHNATLAPRYADWNTVSPPTLLTPQAVTMEPVVPTSVDIAWAAGVPVVVGLPSSAPPAALYPPAVAARGKSGWAPLLVPPDPLGHTGQGAPGSVVRVATPSGPAPDVHIAYDGEVVDSGGGAVHRVFYVRCTPAP